jgi:TonB family protein
MKITRKTLPIILIFVLCGLVFGQNDEKKMSAHCGSGIIMGRAKSLPKPSNAWTTCDCKYEKSEEVVSVQIEIDENGNVTSATTVSRHPFLRANAEAAARNSKFTQSFLNGKPQKTYSELTYIFNITESSVSVRDSQVKFVNIPLGNLNDKAISLPMPKYYSTCAKGATGSLNVQVKIDLQNGNVVEATAVSGHPIYRKLVENTALQAKFDLTKSNLPAKFGTGILTYKVKDFIGYREEMLVETKPVKLGIINGRATFLPKPIYPQTARDFCAKGKVEVEVLVDEKGNVIEAKAISGDALLRESAVEAVKKAKFSQPMIDTPIVKTRGTIVYNFVADTKCVSGEIANKKAIYLPKPILSNVMGGKHLQLKKDEIVKVEIIVDEAGKVTSARAISGHILLRAACENAARNAKFNPTNDMGRIRIKAFLIYKIKPNGEVETKF